MTEQVHVELLVYGYLLEEIAKLRRGWRREVRARKKFLRRQLNASWAVLKGMIKEKANGNA